MLDFVFFMFFFLLGHFFPQKIKREKKEKKKGSKTSAGKRVVGVIVVVVRRERRGIEMASRQHKKKKLSFFSDEQTRKVTFPLLTSTSTSLQIHIRAHTLIFVDNRLGHPTLVGKEGLYSIDRSLYFVLWGFLCVLIC